MASLNQQGIPSQACLSEHKVKFIQFQSQLVMMSAIKNTKHEMLKIIAHVCAEVTLSNKMAGWELRYIKWNNMCTYWNKINK